jgi:hypothetical protein
VNQRSQVICAWIAGISVVFLAIGFFLVTGYVPPPRANESARQIAHFYVSHRARLRIGLLITFLAWGGWGPLVAVIAMQMWRIEGRRPVLALLQVLAGGAGWIFLLLPTLILEIATFRAGSVSPQTTQTLHDLGWILAFMALTPFFVQLLAIAGAIFQDRSENPVFPRWVGYFNVWAAVSFVPGCILIFFKSGPFSYQGLFVFWVPFLVFGGWILLMAWAAGRAAKSDTGDLIPGTSGSVSIASDRALLPQTR